MHVWDREDDINDLLMDWMQLDVPDGFRSRACQEQWIKWQGVITWMNLFIHYNVYLLSNTYLSYVLFIPIIGMKSIWRKGWQGHSL